MIDLLLGPFLQYYGSQKNITESQLQFVDTVSDRFELSDLVIRGICSEGEGVLVLSNAGGYTLEVINFENFLDLFGSNTSARSSNFANNGSFTLRFCV